VSLLSPFFSLVMQTPIFLTKLSDESIIFISDVGKNLFLLNTNFFSLGNLYNSGNFSKTLFSNLFFTFNLFYFGQTIALTLVRLARSLLVDPALRTHSLFANFHKNENLNFSV
jgi:hypothetical protein